MNTYRVYSIHHPGAVEIITTISSFMARAASSRTCIESICSIASLAAPLNLIARQPGRTMTRFAIGNCYTMSKLA